MIPDLVRIVNATVVGFAILLFMVFMALLFPERSGAMTMAMLVVAAGGVLIIFFTCILSVFVVGSLEEPQKTRVKGIIRP